MASLRTLSTAHRRGQATIADETSRLVAPTIRLLNPNDLAGSFDQWFATADRVVQAQRVRSTRLAAQYLNVARHVAIGRPFPPVLARPAAEEGLRTSLTVTGPVALRARLAAGVDLSEALQMTSDGSAAAAARWVLNGGRETVMQTIAADPRADRWQRVTSGSACDFCTMLEGRGFVYVEDTADFESHDHCSCTAEPFYS